MIFGAAVLLRFVALGSAPSGLYQDEAINGLDTLGVLGGNTPLYFPANNGREPIYIYLAALSVGALGPSALALRLPAAILGVLTVPATYALGRAWFDRRVGMLSAAILAVTLWHVHLSRVAFRAVALPFFTALALAAGAHGLRSGKRWALAGAGVAYALTFYTYLPTRFTPLALALILTGVLIWHKQALVARWRRIALMGLVAALVLAPLGLLALRDPDLVLGRAGQVGIWNPAIHGGDPAGTLVRSTFATLGMFAFWGDPIPRHNLPGRPVFDPLLGLAWLVGMGMLLWQFRRNPSATAVVLWIAVLLLPTALAEDAPHFLRAVGVLPVVVVPAAVALARCPRAIAALVLGLSLGLTTYDYFGRYLPDPETRLAFDQAATALATQVNQAEQAIVDWRLWDRYPSVEFLTARHGALYIAYDNQPTPIPATAEAELPLVAGQPLLLAAWPYEPPERLTRFLPSPAQIEITLGPLAIYGPDAEPFHLYAAYHAVPLPEDETTAAPAVAFEDGLALLRVETGGAHGTLQIALYWRASQSPSVGYTAFLHTAGGEAVDAQPGTWAYPTDRWRPGDVIVQRVEYDRSGALELGLYDSATGQRLPVVVSRWPVHENAVSFTPQS